MTEEEEKECLQGKMKFSASFGLSRDSLGHS